MKKTQKVKHEAIDLIKSLLIAVIIALLIRQFVVEIFFVEGKSMHPTLSHSQRLVVNKLTYYFDEPERSDIVVFEYESDKDFIKRIVGLPGEKVKIERGSVYINKQPLNEQYIRKTGKADYGPEKVPENHYFVLGDNRSNSVDSRSSRVGFVREEEIKGKAFFIFWPLENAGFIDKGEKGSYY